MFCSKCGAQHSDNARFCGKCGNPVTENNNNQQVNYQPQSVPNQLGMTFYKILVYFGIPLSILSNFVLAIQYLTGSIYANSMAAVLPMDEIYEMGVSSRNIANIVYSQVDGLKELDILYGIMFIGLAILGAYTWYNLKNFKKESLSLCMKLYAVNMGLTVVYSVIMCMLLDSTGIASEAVTAIAGGAITSIISGVVSIGIIHVYLSNRKHLFIN